MKVVTLWSSPVRFPYNYYLYEVSWMADLSWQIGVMAESSAGGAFDAVMHQCEKMDRGCPSMIRIHGGQDVGHYDLGAVARLPADMVSWTSLPMWN